MFDWARFRRAKGAVKLHLLLDGKAKKGQTVIISI
jgi:hypothetical protein